MATSSFLQFNPTAANQETDAAYLTDATRTGGAGVGAIWPSTSANKTLYQVSTAVAALMQAMANKGFTVSDASLAALTTQLANILTTADLLSNLQSVGWAASLALNAAHYNGFEISLTGNSTLSISGQTVGQLIVLLFAQDGVGGRTITYSGSFVGAAQPDPAAGVISGQIYKVNASGVLQALGPMMSVNGAGGVPIGAFGASTGNFTTPSGGDNSTRAATTAWVHAYITGFAPSGNSVTLPGGFIVKWGTVGGGNPQTVTFAAAFPTALFAVVATPNNFGTGATRNVAYKTAQSGSGFTIQTDSSSVAADWIAIGY